MIKVIRKLSKIKSPNSKLYEVYANKILVATMERELTWVHPVSSSLRYATKQAYRSNIKWDAGGLSLLFGRPVTVGMGTHFRVDFRNTYDMTSLFTKKELEQILNDF